jgi:ABC-type antimicrobial peptide transport system permease subunit
VLGLSAALGVTRVLASTLFEVRPSDPATLVGVTLVLLGAAVTAVLIPARRATRIDPLIALQ